MIRRTTVSYAGVATLNDVSNAHGLVQASDKAVRIESFDDYERGDVLLNNPHDPDARGWGIAARLPQPTGLERSELRHYIAAPLFMAETDDVRPRARAYLRRTFSTRLRVEWMIEFGVWAWRTDETVAALVQAVGKSHARLRAALVVLQTHEHAQDIERWALALVRDKDQALRLAV